MAARRLLTPAEAAEYLGIEESSLRHRVHRRQVPFVKLGRLLRFDIRQLDRFIAENTEEEVA